MDLSIDVSSVQAGSIKYYGGTAEELTALGLFGSVSNDVFGTTIRVSDSLQSVYCYNGESKYPYRFNEIKGYIVAMPGLSYSQYFKTCTHELGHALGWWDHPATFHSTWIMQQGLSSALELAPEEVQHLAQVY